MISHKASCMHGARHHYVDARVQYHAAFRYRAPNGSKDALRSICAALFAAVATLVAFTSF